MTCRAALVTGASGRLGRAVAVALSGRGYKVAAQGRDTARLACTVRACVDPEHTVLPLIVDLTVESAAERVAQAVGSSWGRLDVLAHCAGIYPALPLSAEPRQWSDHWIDVIEHNLTSTARLVRAVLPMLRDAPAPTIVLIGSEPVTRPAARPDREAYYASKGGVVGLSRGLAASLGRDGIHSVVVHPGWIVDDTALTDRRHQLPASAAGEAIAQLIELTATVGLQDVVLVPRPTRKPPADHEVST